MFQDSESFVWIIGLRENSVFKALLHLEVVAGCLYAPSCREELFPETGLGRFPEFSETARKWKSQRLKCSGHDIVVCYKAIGPSRAARTSRSLNMVMSVTIRLTIDS